MNRVLTTRHLHRYKEIVEALVRHSFGAMVAQLNLESQVDLPRRLLHREHRAAVEISPAEHLRLALEELGPSMLSFLSSS
jgi:ubiquinone biosynthesis protein